MSSSYKSYTNPPTEAHAMAVDQSELSSKMSPGRLCFFSNMATYVDLPVYFYGSILRGDYVDGKSDIDAVIFTDNENSTIDKLQNYIQAGRREFRKIVWTLNGDVIHGRKVKCSKYENVEFEVSVYNKNYKEALLREYNRPKTWSPLVFLGLRLIKLLYYTLPLLTKTQYGYLKRLLMNYNVYSDFYMLRPDEEYTDAQCAPRPDGGCDRVASRDNYPSII
jgi:predicted nucleotidyltransferase